MHGLVRKYNNKSNGNKSQNTAYHDFFFYNKRKSFCFNFVCFETAIKKKNSTTTITTNNKNDQFKTCIK